MLDLRVEVRFKNAVLWNNLRPRYDSVRAASKAIGVPVTSLYSLLNLRLSPWSCGKGRHRDAMPPVGVTGTAEKISQALGVPAEDLFPLHLYRNCLPKLVVRELDSSRYLTLAEARSQRLLPQTTEPIDENLLDLPERINEVLQVLKPRQKEVVERYFGLNGKPETTLSEMAEEGGVSKTTIGLRLQQALTRLRRPGMHRFLVEGKSPLTALREFLAKTPPAENVPVPRPPRPKTPKPSAEEVEFVALRILQVAERARIKTFDEEGFFRLYKLNDIDGRPMTGRLLWAALYWLKRQGLAEREWRYPMMWSVDYAGYPGSRKTSEAPDATGP